MATIPVTILHGFLGSGKTTLLRNLLTQSQQADAVPAIVVNDMSELDVDGVLIANTEVIERDDKRFITISGDSISSPNGIAQLDTALSALLQSENPPWLLIETSGSSHPLPLIEYFKGHSLLSLQGVVTLVDAVWLRDDYQQGQSLIPKWQANLQANVRGIENLLVEQLMFSNRILLTKSDRLKSSEIKAIAEAIHPINPYAAIVQTSWGNIGFEQLRDIESYNFFLIEQLANELRDSVNDPLTISGKHGQRLVSKVIHDDRPFHPQRLWDTCHRYLTQGVFRSKGFFWMPTRDDVSLLWSQTNGSVGLEVVGFWRAPILDDESQKFTSEQYEMLKARVDSTESRFGDRRCRLTVIGQNEEVDQFVIALNRCFLTDDELVAWQNGEPFDDPWPQKVASL
ncbi:CobW family GTP-binding protein [Thaumasiovibrio subtropicus]|uniref:CobW family GTP-binding protein n=1 Tax=Thaumasiovibrio subtropicus TaxID=1891207 RepID=UPI000B35F943|nr:GTP-binding protein [Thaumasiovibrio subtropicus]